MTGKNYPFKFTTILSSRNPRIKNTLKLRERKYRDREKQTLLEGYREIKRAVEFGFKPDTCFFCDDFFLGCNEIPLLKTLAESGVKIVKVSDYILRKLAYRDRPEGLIAIARVREHPLTAMKAASDGLYLIAERIEKPGNLGAILRAADAAGASGIILCDKNTDIYNPNTIRASTGAIFAAHIAESFPEEIFRWLKNNQIKIIAADPYADKFYTQIDMRTSAAIVVGSEQYGLSDFWKEKADYKVKIPMLGKIDSLNVATAASILLYEAVRQRISED